MPVNRILKMNDTKEAPGKKRVLVTITPYNEQEKRVVNGTTTSSSGGPPPPAPPLPLSTKGRSNEDSVEMQSIESFKLKETPNPVIPKPPPTYFPVSSGIASTNGSPRHAATAAGKAQINGKEQLNGTDTTKASPMTQVVSPTATEAQQASAKATGKVAIRIGAYEGEAKQPSRLEFLSQQSRVDKNGGDELASAPVASRLQNELVATLQRSNLRRKTDGDNQSVVKTIPENATTSNNETMNSDSSKPPQGNVEKLASALANKVTIKVIPENGSR